jgi:ubiquinone/menaquinone biosynthesis C-methylase UbiE
LAGENKPQAIKDWPGKIMIVPYGVKDKSLKRRIERRWGKGIICGGNSVNAAFGAFITQTEAKIYIFIGYDLSYKKTYYADGRESPHDKSGNFWATNVKGQRVKTLMPLYQYKVWAESIMSELYPHYHFSDCSGGILGLDTNNRPEGFIRHKTLKQAIIDVKTAYDVEAMNETDKKKYMYDAIYLAGYGTQNSKKQWEQLLPLIPFNKGIDVGCGIGVGVRHARDEGHDVVGCDLADITTEWEKMGIEEYCKIAPAREMPYEDNSFDLVVCGEVMEHIPEEEVDESLAEMYRIGSDKFLFTICLTQECWPALGYLITHCTIKPAEWWIHRIQKAGFKIYEAHAGHNYNFKKMRGLFVYAVKDPEPYKRGERQIAMGGSTREEIKGMGHDILIEPTEGVYDRVA